MTAEKQVRTNVAPELHEEMTRASRRLGITKKEFLKQAIQAKLGKFDVDLRCKRLSAENTTLSVEKEQFRTERDEARQQIEHIQLEMTNERDDGQKALAKAEKERDEARQQRDRFKVKMEEAQESIVKLEADLEAHQNRGVWDRLLNRKVTA